MEARGKQRRHVLYLRYAFPSRDEPGPKRHLDIVDFLLEHGYEVTVITSGINFMTGLSGRPLAGVLLEVQSTNGCHIIRTRNIADYRRSAVGRMMSYALFALLATYAGVKVAGAEGGIVTLVDISPPSAAVAGWLLAHFIRRNRLILEITDLPETMFVLGFLNLRSIIRFTRKLFRHIYRRADGVVTLTPSASDRLIHDGVPSEKVHLVPNWYTGSANHQEDRDSFRKKIGWDRKFVVLYAGGHGQAYDLMSLVRSAELLSNRGEIQFVFVGEGEKKESYMMYCERVGLTNCLFLAAQPRERLGDFIRGADVCVNLLRKHPFWRCVIGHKIFDYFENGRPVVFAGEGDTADLVNTARGGLVVEPESPVALAEALTWMYEHPLEREEMGRRGQMHVKESYAREELLGRLERVLDG